MVHAAQTQPFDASFDDVEPWQCFTEGHRCPRCGGWDQCTDSPCSGYVSKDGCRVVCTRQGAPLARVPDEPGTEPPLRELPLVEEEDRTDPFFAHARSLTSAELLSIDSQSTDWLVDERLPATGNSLLVGHAGSGKSRLIHEFKRRIAGEPGVVLEARCSSLSQAMPDWVWINLLERHFGIESRDGPVERRAKVADGVREWDPDLDEIYPYLCRMMKIPLDDGLQLPADELRRGVFRAMSRHWGGLMQKGLDGSSIHLNPCRITPGSASGTQWLGTMSPALPYEHPEHTSPFSTTTT